MTKEEIIQRIRELLPLLPTDSKALEEFQSIMAYQRYSDEIVISGTFRELLKALAQCKQDLITGLIQEESSIWYQKLSADFLYALKAFLLV